MIRKIIQKELTGFWQEISVSLSKKRVVDCSLMAVTYLVGCYLNFDFETNLIFLAFMWNILNPVPCKVLFQFALALTALVPFLLIIKRSPQAEQVANWAFFSFILAGITLFLNRADLTIEYKDS